MSSEIMLSLCMPTNGVSEWVFPVLDSIYAQGVEESLFEIVITDNGKNDEFKKNIMKYVSTHSNITYAETDALPFINEIEAYKRARGKLIKFVNHRTKMVQGALKRILDFSKANSEDKPIIYFTNGLLNKRREAFQYTSFDQFVRNLSFWSSWSTGMTIWKEDFQELSDNLSDYNELFPHTKILFNERNRSNYIIDNTVIFDEIPQNKKPKGNYDLYYAFGIEYPWIICNLLREKSISAESYRTIIRKNLGFITDLYLNYNIRKKYCSYDLTGLKDIYGIFYTKPQFFMCLCITVIKRMIKKLLGRN